jgi:hypothetical protein
MVASKVVLTRQELGTRIVLREVGSRPGPTDADGQRAPTAHHEVWLGNVRLLSSAALQTEREFGQLVKALVPAAGRVLVGGLGFGMTVRGVLDGFDPGPVPEVVVAEKLSTVIEITREHLSQVAGDVLADGRVRVVQEDVWATLEAAPDSYDAVLLDVDNGPNWASFRSNERLYAEVGLSRAIAALRPGGILAVWSGYEKDGFLGRLNRAGLESSVVPLFEGGVVRARAYVGRKHG